jgi:DNA-binding transcriptional MerR regulator
MFFIKGDGRTAMKEYQSIDNVAKSLDVSPSTIKKYYLLLEKNNYRFNRNNKGHLVFYEKDILLFRKLIQLKNTPGLTLEKAVEVLLEKEKIVSNELGLQMRIVATKLSELKSLMKQQTEILVKQQEQLNKMEERYELLNEILRLELRLKR